MSRQRKIDIAIATAAVLLLAVAFFIGIKREPPPLERVNPGEGRVSLTSERAAMTALDTDPNDLVASHKRGDASKKNEGLLTSWERIPARILSLRPCLRTGAQTPEFGKPPIPMDYMSLLARINEEALHLGFDPQEKDEEKRALGVAQTLDFFIGKSAGIEPFSRWSNGMDPSYYAPVGLLDGVKPPEDPARTQEMLLSLWSDPEGVGRIVSKLPSQHQIPGVEEAIRARALAMAANLGPNVALQAVLQDVLDDAGQPSPMKAVAFNALLAQGDEAAARSWIDRQQDWDLLRAVADGLMPMERRRSVVRDPVHGGSYVSLVSTGGRGLDDKLVELYDRAPDAQTRGALAAALAGRTDDPMIKDRVVSMMRSKEPEVVIQILRQRPLLTTEDGEFQSALRDLIDSADVRVKGYALQTICRVPDPRVRDLLASELDSEHRGIAIVAMWGLCQSGRYDPVGTISIVERAKAARSDDEEFVKVADGAIHDMQRILDDPIRYRSRNEEWLKSVGLLK
jgi:hypothetical protein